MRGNPVPYAIPTLPAAPHIGWDVWGFRTTHISRSQGGFLDSLIRGSKDWRYNALGFRCNRLGSGDVGAHQIIERQAFEFKAPLAGPQAPKT